MENTIIHPQINEQQNIYSSIHDKVNKRHMHHFDAEAGAFPISKKKHS
jgi:hypothetical protein